MAKVSMSLGKTINCGNYESFRVDCSIETRCNDENVEQSMDALYEEVADLLQETIDKAKKDKLF